MEKIGDLAVRKKAKKALSPVIATVLLIALAVILILIILLLFKGFIKEVVEKNDQPAEYSCENVNLEVGRSGTISDTKLDIVNKGNVPVNKIAVKKIKTGASDTVYPEISKDIAPGETRADVEIGDVSGYTKLNIIPILLGNVKGGTEKEYQCPDKYGKTISATT